VVFVDQEAEWNSVIEYVRRTMSREEIEPHWIQCPIRLFNATSSTESWLHCWAEGEDWMRDKEPDSIQVNDFGTDRFHDIFPAYLQKFWPDQKAIMLAGVRCEESPNRRTGLTHNTTYKWVTWGKHPIKKREHYTFYPLYDWTWRDIWKSIHDNKWDYCKVYDEFYRYGISPMQMRVSNLHHETAVHQLFYLQEIEGETWDKLTQRLSGINQARHLTKSDMFQVKKLPFMFSSRKDYRDYLVKHLLVPEQAKLFNSKFAAMDIKWGGMSNAGLVAMYRSQINCVLSNDFEFTKMDNFESRAQVVNYRKWKAGKLDLSIDRSLFNYLPEGWDATS